MPPRRSRKPKPIVRKRTTRASAKKRRLSAKRQPAAQVKRNSKKETRVKQRKASGVISSGRRVSRKSRNNRIRLTKHMKANDDMTIIELQKMAREQGIPFGGLSKSKLLRKINNYLESSY
jgi:hypothetical protein